MSRTSHLKKPTDFGKQHTITKVISSDSTDTSEILCSKCGKMILVDTIEKHSDECFYQKKYEEIVEDKLSTLNRADIALSKLYNCMMDSKALKSMLTTDELEYILKICKDAENLGEVNDKEICLIRERIANIKRIQNRFSAKTNPTVFTYLERMLFCLQVIFK